MKNFKINKKKGYSSFLRLLTTILKRLEMIPMVVLYISRKFKVGNLILKRFLKFKTYFKKAIPVLFLFIVTSNYGSNSSAPTIFNIIKNNTVIGTIKITKNISRDSVIYNIESNVEAQFILKFKVVAKEKYIYKAGTLIYSSLFRMLNNKVKTNHSIQYNKGEYSLKTSEKVKALNIEEIKCNLTILYINEPIGIKSVFCDNQQEMVNVVPMGKGKYKVELSKGKYNIFHYKNGRCVKIEAVSPLYDVTLIPVLS